VYFLSVPWESSVGFCSSTDESAGKKSKAVIFLENIQILSVFVNQSQVTVEL
jgi:hypothetical protein